MWKRNKKRTENPQELLCKYYKSIADLYDDMHIHPTDAHYVALNFISAFINILNIRSVLDIGCGTGRGIGYLMHRHPELLIRGSDISVDLLKIATRKNKIPQDYLSIADATSLPFKDGTFDAVLELGLLHHIKQPNQVVKEMLRVAKKAVFVSDSNRFGQGGLLKKLVKLVLFRMGAWNCINYIKTNGKGYSYSEGDGVAYSYSVFDSLPVLRKANTKIITIPTIWEGDFSTLQLLKAPHLLVCAIKE